MKLVASNAETTAISNQFPDLTPEMKIFVSGARFVVGSNLTSWLKEAGISEANALEQLGISALELRSWEKGIVSPQASKYLAVVSKLGDEIYYKASLLVADLTREAQIIRMASGRASARGLRWDGGFHPESAALGAKARRAA